MHYIYFFKVPFWDLPYLEIPFGYFSNLREAINQFISGKREVY